ncbi:MAG TPA: twin-arginine translocase TatA/TatE family subunit [Desulfuromonadales bacterium]|nr:twin-arginine translocase TatA/TatE family subunit [Desulfuromonadales bacterium]
MFGLGPSELILILLLVLIVFGAGKLPEIGGALGKGLRSFKDAVNSEHDEESSEDAKQVEDTSSEEHPHVEAKQDENKQDH